MNDILKMIVEDEHLFKAKNDGSLDPLALEKLTRQKRQELKDKLDKHSAEGADKMREEIIQEFSLYRSLMKKEIDQQITSTAESFNEKLDSNLNRFNKEINQVLSDISKPIDLLDTSYVQESKYQNMQKIFDLKDYMKSDFDSNSTVDEKLWTQTENESKKLSIYDLRNFEYNPTQFPPPSKPQTIKIKILLKMRSLLDQFKKKIDPFKKIAFNCFKK